MALLGSSTYLGTLLKQRVIVNNRAHVGLVLLPHILLRRNASTSRLKPSPKATEKSSKATRKSPLSSSVQKTQTSATSESVSSNKASTQNATRQETANVSADAKKHQEMSEEEQEKQLQRMLQMSELMPTMDIFGQQINSTLDVMIPYPNGKSLSFPRKKFQHLRSNFENNLKNAMALNMLSAFDAIPGVRVPTISLLSRLRHKLRLFGTQSTKPDGLLAPFRQIILELYEELNAAVANRNEREIRKLTTWDYQTHTLGIMKSSLKSNPGGRLIWQLHRVVEPVQVLSLRVMQGHYGETEPKFGNRLLTHALVKFDTEQSLEIYDRNARPLHESEKTPAFIDAKKKLEKWRVPAVKRRVQEYLVLEKRMWVQGPWVFREQMWPTWPLEEGEETSELSDLELHIAV